DMWKQDALGGEGRVVLAVVRRAAKNLSAGPPEILRGTQNDTPSLQISAGPFALLTERKL
ncbi:MAG: hypothetical protein ACR2H5_07715, partial [Ktedonobacteraceae bacterium]